MSEKEFILQLGQKLRKLRLKAGLTQEDVEAFDVNVKQYQRIERGIVNPRAYTLFKLCKAFKCSPNNIFGH